MKKICRYAFYEMKLFFRVKTAFFYSILFPLVLLILYFASTYNGSDFNAINNYFPYLISITLISTAAGLASVIVNNRIYNSWKFFNLFGYKTQQMTTALGVVYYVISVIISLLMIFVMFFILSAMTFNLYKLFLMYFAISLGTILYIEIAIITGLIINEPRNAQTIINGLIYFFIIVSGSLIRFDENNVLGRFMLLFPNIHIGNLMYSIWNFSQVNLTSICVLVGYCIFFALIIWIIIKKQNRRFLY